MVEKKNNNVIIRSVKWSSLAEIGVKLITPITTMILARLLTPEAFGILAVCNMILFFGDIISDAGFAKFIIQADFNNRNQFNKYVTVAFWSHLVISILILIIIIITASSLSSFLGISGFESVIIVANISLIFKSIISTQISILRRKFEFKKSFVARIVTTISIFVITIPLAFITKSYWALIIGNLVGNFINSIVLVYLTKWVPSLFYSFEILKVMFGYSFWSMMEGLAHWFIFWFDVFIVTQFFSTYLVGLYKNSTAIILSFITMITAAISPVLLSTLSRIKGERNYINVYMSITKLMMYILLPISITIFFCRDFVTLILLGNKWMEGANIIGVWALMLAISVFIYSFPAEIFKSKGIPKYLFFYQTVYIIFLVPICIYSAKLGFWQFVYARAAAVLIQIILFFIFFEKVLKWRPRLIVSHYKYPSFSNLLFFIVCFIPFFYLNNIYLRFGLGFIFLSIYFISVYKIFKTDILNAKYILTNKDEGLLIDMLDKNDDE